MADSPYKKGTILNLQNGDDQEPFYVIIQDQLLPFTNSVTLVVDILDHQVGVTLPKRGFLKLFDRRYATGLRDHWGVPEWSSRLDTELLEFSQSGNAASLLEAWRENPHMEFDFDWPSSSKETILAELMIKDFETEAAAYHTLRDHQGKLIPNLLNTVVLPIGPDPGPDEETSEREDAPVLGHSPELFEINGVLLEYIAGFTASEICCWSDPADWAYLIQRATKVAGHVMDSREILHENVTPKNMVISHNPYGPRGYRIVMTDFTNCLFRVGESDQEWAVMKHRYDEERMLCSKLEKQWGRGGVARNCPRNNPAHVGGATRTM